MIATSLTTLGDSLAAIAALEAIDEFIASDIQAKNDQQELDDKLEKMQKQIDGLTDELAQIKKDRRVNSGFR